MHVVDRKYVVFKTFSAQIKMKKNIYTKILMLQYFTVMKLLFASSLNIRQGVDLRYFFFYNWN